MGNGIKKTIGSFSVEANRRYWVSMAPPSNRVYPHAFQFKRLILKSRGEGQLMQVAHFMKPKQPDTQPGFGKDLVELHPCLDIKDLTPAGKELKVTGVQAIGPQQALVTTLDSELFHMDWSQAETQLKLIAKGEEKWMDALVYQGRTFVLAKKRIIELKDEDQDGFFESHLTLADDWKTSADSYEFLFGGVVVDDHLYFASSVGMDIRSTHNRQVSLRGSAIKVHLATGKSTLLAGGFRVPNGMCLNADQEIFIADNQGEWLPASKIIHLQDQAFYNFRYRPKHPLDCEDSTPPALWLPYGELALSPSEPIFLDKGWGVYAGQGVIGDIAKDGLRRFNLEKVNGVYQGAVFRWSQGLNFKTNRIARVTDSSILMGRLARGNNWDKSTHPDSLKLLQYRPNVPFEILKVIAKSNGFQMEFTKSLKNEFGWNVNNMHMERWRYQATQLYGGKKLFHDRVTPKSLSLSEDGRILFIETPELESGQVVYFRLPEKWESESGEPLWSGEAWYTLNEIPKNSPGIIKEKPLDVSPSPELFSYQSEESGLALYQQYCLACHSTGQQQLIGPSFHHSLGRQRMILKESGDEALSIDFNQQYISESILDPNAKVVKGFPKNIMPSFGSILSPQQIQLLTDYIYQVTQAK
jgi:cytochrome c